MRRDATYEFLKSYRPDLTPHKNVAYPYARTVRCTDEVLRMVRYGTVRYRYTYCDDSYLLAPTEQMATALHLAPCIFAKVGLRLGYGPGKTELILPKGCSMQDFPLPLDDPHTEDPQVVAGFKSCLGVPRHFDNDLVFLNDALQAM